MLLYKSSSNYSTVFNTKSSAQSHLEPGYQYSCLDGVEMLEHTIFNHIWAWAIEWLLLGTRLLAWQAGCMAAASSSAFLTHDTGIYRFINHQDDDEWPQLVALIYFDSFITRQKHQLGLQGTCMGFWSCLCTFGSALQCWFSVTCGSLQNGFRHGVWRDDRVFFYFTSILDFGLLISDFI